MKRKAKVLFLSMFASCALCSFAEENNIPRIDMILPQTPQAAALARYGEYPVGHTSGVPQIDIPLYDVVLGSYHLPISISYHASGNKVNDVASYVGLGWSLNAGGVITRSIMGADDLRYNVDRSYYNPQKIAHQRDAEHRDGFQNYDEVSRVANATFDYLDSEADKFTYNFNGHVGMMRYDYKQDRFRSLNAEPIQIFHTAESYLGSGDSHFVIVDSDGIEYTFDVAERTGVHEDGEWPLVSSWYLSNISTPNGDIKLKYVKGESFSQYFHRQTLTAGEFGNVEVFPSKNSNPCIKSIWTCTKVLYMPQLLSSIEWNGNKVTFSYASDRTDICPQRLMQMKVTNADGEIVREVTFDNNLYLGSTKQNKRMLLRSLIASNEGKYIFSYDMTALPNYAYDAITYSGWMGIPCQTDYWGYYNARSSRHHIPKKVAKQLIEFAQSTINYNDYIQNGADKTPQEKGTMAGILKSIKYPTGGYTNFTFEQNKAGSHLYGGLRIKKIENRSPGGQVLSSKTYDYRHVEPTVEDFDRDWKYKTILRIPWIATLVNRIDGDFLEATSEPLTALCDNTGCPVFYTVVWEIDNDGRRISYGYRNGSGHQETMGVFDETKHPQLQQYETIDRGRAFPLLVGKTVFDVDNKPILSEDYSYYTFTPEQFSLGMRILQVFGIAYQEFDHAQGLDKDVDINRFPRAEVKAYVNTYLLSKKTTTDHRSGFEVTEEYTYDEQLRTHKPKEVRTIGSDGRTYTSTTKYIFEDDTQMSKAMASREYNMVDMPIETKTFCDNDLIEVSRYRYVERDLWGFVPSVVETSQDGKTFKTDIAVLKWDAKNNPISIRENGAEVVNIIWGFNNSLPVASIIGPTYTEVESRASDIINKIATSNDAKTMSQLIAKLRTAIGRIGLIYTYNHKSLVGVSSITDPRGLSSIFTYDDGGRLNSIGDAVRGTTTTINYNYANQ